MNLKEEVEIAWAEHRLAFHLHALSRRPATPSIPLGRLPTQERKSHTADTSDAGQLRALQKQLEISGYENGALKADVQSLQAELDDLGRRHSAALEELERARAHTAHAGVMGAPTARAEGQEESAQLQRRLRALEEENASLRLNEHLTAQTMHVMRYRLSREEGLRKRVDADFAAARKVAEQRLEHQARSIQRRAMLQQASRRAVDQQSHMLAETALREEIEGRHRQNLEHVAESKKLRSELSSKKNLLDLQALDSQINEDIKMREASTLERQNSQRDRCMRADGNPLRPWLEQKMRYELKKQYDEARARGRGKGGPQIRHDKFVDQTPMLQTGEAVESALGIENLLCVSEQELHSKIARGVAAIREEFERAGTSEDKECLHYVLHQAAGSSKKLFPNSPWPRDCDAHGVRADRIVEAGVHAGRPMVLVDFVAAPESQKAQLTEAQVVALRLYTTAAFKSINGPLRDAGRQARHVPHPLAATVAFIKEGLSKLRAADAENKPLDLWRGMRNLQASDDFVRFGGSERGVMSTTSDENVAIQYGMSKNSLVFKIVATSFIQRGASLRYLSAFPGEAEMCYGPLTYLKPTGKMEVVEVTYTPVEPDEDEGMAAPQTAKITVVEVEPTV